MNVKIIANDKGNPPGKLADVELHFTSGPLEGLKLVGFGVWERRTGAGRNVTFPARQYSVNGSGAPTHCSDRWWMQRRRSGFVTLYCRRMRSTRSQRPR
jgi:hypothetical protein